MLRIVGELVDGQCARSVGKVVVGRRQVVSGRRDGRRAHGGGCGRRAQRWHASDVGAAGVFIVDIAGYGAGQRRVGRAVETHLVVRRNRQLRLVDGQRAINKTHRVIGAGHALRCYDVAASILCTLARACVAQRAAQNTGRLAVNKAAVVHAVATCISHAVVGLASSAGGDAQGRFADRADAAND